jgi:hypothetical protein
VDEAVAVAAEARASTEASSDEVRVGSGRKLRWPGWETVVVMECFLPQR